MNENLNLVEILKDCPKGTKLYSTIYGEVTFSHINNSSICPIIIRVNDDFHPVLTKDGRHAAAYKGECTLFPSKDQRDWSKFTAPWYKKEKLVELKESDEKIRKWIIDDIRYNMNNEPLNNSEYKKKAEKAIAWLEKQGEQNLSSANERAWLYLVSDVLTWKDGIGQYLDNPIVQEIAKRLCDKYAQKLYNPSVLSDSSNTVKNEQKFDPKMLKPFDKILVCDDLDDIWRASIFSHIYDNKSIVTTSSIWLYGIPYNDDTKHLVGTYGEAPEYYRYWED